MQALAQPQITAQQVHQQQRPPARHAVAAPPRSCGSLGGSLARSSSSGSGGGGRAACRLPPVCARRERDPILAPVIQMGPGGEDVVDLYGYLLRNRIIFLNQRISDQVACQVVASLLALDSLNEEEEIKMYINCPQGSPYAVVSILDTMRAIKAPNTRILLQQPMGGLQGSADECNITATELNRNMRVMYRFLSEATGLPVETVEMECDRDNFLGPEQAIALGLIDSVIA
ncbi:hypothetical protein CHLNCDRAFT_139949 [Chlorella variabilis]|uniref:ATP-dependent Clp protease proteolytic subunit n=1 Tax=Chlorella variabilis TaxID=554065 RepID=E1ZR97_CHLVA|nr:hypothetical protein CHLNCDRAFT_139949 [Chlorella variabilis]EFN51696.1 hypothetical protein CHLNCDRAFT_139949 [Chlorella variabilis]|eukprot:XP_005843798.1 hypothetical protein CHLNCDRAFT_139949 [Chlorella variabilis]